MSRSVKKGPYVEASLKEKIEMLNSKNELGEFAPTRLFRGHGRAEAAAAATAATTGPAPAASAGAPERATTVKAGA